MIKIATIEWFGKWWETLFSLKTLFYFKDEFSVYGCFFNLLSNECRNIRNLNLQQDIKFPLLIPYIENNYDPKKG